MKCIVLALFVFVPMFVTLHLVAQVNPYKEGTPGVSGYRSEVLSEVIVQEDKFTRLAEAIPAEKYTWRPAADVRSFAEVFLHVSAANYSRSPMHESLESFHPGRKTRRKSRQKRQLKRRSSRTAALRVCGFLSSRFCDAPNEKPSRRPGSFASTYGVNL
jgi:hypothetical protein